MALEALSIIDVDTSQPFLSVVHAKQYDSVRKVEAHLFFSGVKWYVPSSNIYAVVSYKKSDRIGGFYDMTEDGITAVVPDGDDRSVIYISLDRNMLTKPGQARTEVIFFDTITGGQLGSFAFIIEIEETSISTLDMSTSPYFALLAHQIQAVLKADSRFSNMQASATKLKPNANPTAEVTLVGEGTNNEYYNINLGIPSMPAVTASATKLAPNATPTATVSGGTTAGQAYNIALGIPSMPSLTASATKLAPNATPTATVSGGTTAGQAYNIKIGVPSMPAITASAETVSTTASPTVEVSGGASAGQAYNLKFKLPRNGSLVPESTAHRYALGANNQDIPSSGWVSSVSDLGGSSAVQGKYIWVENKVTWTDDYVETFYLPTYNGINGEELHITIASLSSLPFTITHGDIKAEMRVVNCVWGTPSAITGDVTWTTANGSLSLSGSISGSTTAEIDLLLF